jgi:hypothetical protein
MVESNKKENLLGEIDTISYPKSLFRDHRNKLVASLKSQL